VKYQPQWFLIGETEDFQSTYMQNGHLLIWTPKEIEKCVTTPGNLPWQGGRVSMTTHMAVRSMTMIILLSYLALRPEKSISTSSMSSVQQRRCAQKNASKKALNIR
jgi:hypothetical protein